MPNHSLLISEEERQMILLALAELSIARPGWLSAIEKVAIQIDNQDKYGQAELFEAFRLNHSNALAETLRKPA